MHRAALFLILGLTATLPACPAAPHRQLIWSDEFNGSTLDLTKWTPLTGGNGWGNNELETYTARPQNLHVEHGHLVIEARHESFTGADGIARAYTSARIETRGHFAATYGRFEARMRLPLGQGLWPAFWMLGADVDTGAWPRCGEIDIMENIGAPRRVYGTLHGPGYSGAHGLQSHFDLPADQAVDAAFHTYAVEWEPSAIRFYVDNHLYATQTPASIPAGATWVYTHPFFLLLNLAVGGNWPGAPAPTMHFPQQLLVDWVRVYR